jgi:hypothetical protein
MTVWKVALFKIEFTEQEYSLHSTPHEAMAAAGDLTDFLGLKDAPETRITAVYSPVTGEWFMIEIEGVQNG